MYGDIYILQGPSTTKTMKL